MNLDHLYFDIVSDLELRISDFASLGIFTLVKNPLQISSFMQNKPNFQKSQMNVNLYNTRDYERKRDWTLGESKPNSNPIKPNFQKAKMNITSLITKDYRKKDDFEVRINKPNLVRRRQIAKMNANAFLQKDYENETTLRPQKNKPKTNPISKQKSDAGSQRLDYLFFILCPLPSVLCPLFSVFCLLSMATSIKAKNKQKNLLRCYCRKSRQRLYLIQ